MRQKGAYFLGGQAGGERRVDIPHHYHHIRSKPCSHLFESGPYLSDLRKARSGTHVEENIRRPEFKIFKEYTGHIVIVMLARMHKERIEAPRAVKLPRSE